MVQKIKRLWQELRATAAIDPAAHSPRLSPNRASSLAYALAGCLYMLRWQKNCRILAGATIAVSAIGLWLSLEATDWAILLLTIGLVWVTEFINAALEAAVNLCAAEYQPMAKVAKDVAAAAVLLAALISLLVGGLLLGPGLLERLRLFALAN